jgi:inhibitor of cysteine peptidase
MMTRSVYETITTGVTKKVFSSIRDAPSKGRFRKQRWAGVLLATVTLLALALASSAQSSSPPPEPPSPPEIQIGAQDNGRQVRIHEGQTLVISLAANPSTGYGWEPEHAGLSAAAAPILIQVGSEYLPTEPSGQPGNLSEVGGSLLLGVPATQVLRFVPAAEGKTTLRLLYRRPWEKNLAPSAQFSLDVEAVGAFTDSASPPLSTSAAADAQAPADLGPDAQSGLPSSLNWCDLGACTPVRNQGSCGSCWAFSTIGALESNLLYRDGVARDLSEQYLLSCNIDGWDCAGGWFAHEYHEWKFPAGEPEAGAVYETDFPYTGRDYDPCNPPHTHHEKIVDWRYVGGPSGVPPIADIKQAILDYGPVAVAIYTGDDFRAYTGGVFNSQENGSPNHAVVLVGWDDTQGPNGIWYLRTSWGPYWGEDGYMRIRYGVSNVGYAANYVVYYPSCYNLAIAIDPESTGSVVADPLPNCEGGLYEPDTVVELTANPSAGWHFLSWSGDASGSANPVVIHMDSSKSVVAQFMCDGCSLRSRSALVMKEYER